MTYNAQSTSCSQIGKRRIVGACRKPTVDTIWVVSSPQPLGAPCQTEPQRHHPWPWSCERTKRHASGWISTRWTEVLSETWQWKMMEHANYYRILHNRTIMCLRDFPSPSRNYQRVTNCQANSTKLRAPNASHPVKQICHPDWHHSAVAHKRLPTGRLCAAFGCPTMIQQGNKERLGKLGFLFGCWNPLKHVLLHTVNRNCHSKRERTVQHI